MPSLPNHKLHFYSDTAFLISNLQAYFLWQPPFLQHVLIVVMQQFEYSIFHNRDILI